MSYETEELLAETIIYWKRKADEAEAQLARVTAAVLEEDDKQTRILNDWKHTARRHLGLYKGEKELRARDRAEARALAREAASVIEGLADQQAMSDDWYEEPLARIKAAGEEPEQ